MLTRTRLIETDPPAGTNPRAWFLPTALVLIGAVFVFLPGTFVDKATAAMHGLCAQTPSHSFAFAGTPLPFDARMTGIYGGALTTGLYLLAKRRHQAAAMPPLRVLVAFGLSVIALGLDGVNSLATDLGLNAPYPPDNRLRLLTGLLLGIALTTMLAWLCATTLWRHADPGSAAIGGLGEWFGVVALQIPFVLVATSGVPLAAIPVVVYLLAGAIWVFATFLLLAALLATGRDRRYATAADASPAAALACLGAVALILGLSLGRFALEAAFGIPAPV